MKKVIGVLGVACLVLAVSLTVCSKKEGAASSGQQKTITIKMAHTGSEPTAAHQAFLAMKDYLEKNSNGVFQATIYPNGTLGKDPQLVEAVQQGDIQLMFTNTAYFAQFVPEVSVYAVPFAFPNTEVAFKVLDGEFGKSILDMMEEKCHVVGLSYIEAVAFRELSANRLIRVPSDLKGLKLRVMTNPIQTAIWETLGAQPTPVTFAELYTALQQGTIDAQENPVELFVSSKFYELQKQLIMTNHVFQCGIFVANPEWFHGLTPELQKVVRDAAMQGTLHQRKITAESYEQYIKTIKDAGVTITEITADEANQWKEKVLPVIPIIAREVGGMEVIDRLYAAVEAASK
jgi:tripartite ATP-independent transporter DctP family solute receptor